MPEEEKGQVVDPKATDDGGPGEVQPDEGEIITGERYEELLEKEKKHDVMAPQHGKVTNELGELRKKYDTLEQQRQAQREIVQPTTDFDPDDSESVTATIKGLRNDFNTLKSQQGELNDPTLKRKQAEEVSSMVEAITLIKNDSVLKKMGKAIALKELDTVIAWANEGDVVYDSYKDALTGFRKEFGGTGQVEETTETNTDRTIKRIARQVRTATTQVTGGGVSAQTQPVKDEFFAIKGEDIIETVKLQADYLSDLQKRDPAAYEKLFKEVNAEAPGAYDESTGQYVTKVGARPGETE